MCVCVYVWFGGASSPYEILACVELIILPQPIFFKSMSLLFLLDDAVYFINVSDEAILYTIIMVIINNNKQLLDTELHDFKKHRLKDKVLTQRNPSWVSFCAMLTHFV